MYVGPGLLDALAELATPVVTSQRWAVITDRNVARAHSVSLPAPTLIVAPGERSKSRRRWANLTDRLLELGFGRDSVIVALGGGVVGDLAGFVAATYQRGVPWIQVPTTLLAMVDASVGGKTGVDTPHGKNLVGAFHPPRLVVADILTLATLPEPVYRAGLAEVVKHGVIADAEYFEWIESRVPEILKRDPTILSELVRKSVSIKGRIVMADEFEQGERAVLNAGHTIGHAVEAASEFSIPHGEAVAIGLAVETMLAESIGLASAGLHSRVVTLLNRLGLPTRIPSFLPVDELLTVMRHDKKNRGGEIHLVFAAQLGEMATHGTGWTHSVPEATLVSLLRSRTNET